MPKIHTPMHKQAQIYRGLMKRVEDLEQSRESTGRVDFSRVVTEVATAATATAEQVIYDDPSFVWDHDHPNTDDSASTGLGFDMLLADEDAPRAVSSDTTVGPGGDGGNGGTDPGDGGETTGGFGTAFGDSFGN